MAVLAHDAREHRIAQAIRLAGAREKGVEHGNPRDEPRRDDIGTPGKRPPVPVRLEPLAHRLTPDIARGEIAGRREVGEPAEAVILREPFLARSRRVAAWFRLAHGLAGKRIFTGQQHRAARHIAGPADRQSEGETLRRRTHQGEPIDFRPAERRHQAPAQAACEPVACRQSAGRRVHFRHRSRCCPPRAGRGCSRHSVRRRRRIPQCRRRARRPRWRSQLLRSRH